MILDALQSPESFVRPLLGGLVAWLRVQREVFDTIVRG